MYIYRNLRSNLRLVELPSRLNSLQARILNSLESPASWIRLRSSPPVQQVFTPTGSGSLWRAGKSAHSCSHPAAIHVHYRSSMFTYIICIVHLRYTTSRMAHILSCCILVRTCIFTLYIINTSERIAQESLGVSALRSLNSVAPSFMHLYAWVHTSKYISI